jgi:5-formyltetrahydrofolate cyclo-ligase
MAAPHVTPPSTIDADKQALRARALTQRRGLDAAGAGDALAGHVLAAYQWAAGTVIAGYWPIGDEIDLRPLLHRLHALACLIALPVTPRRGEALIFRAWTPGSELVAERFGTVRPTGPVVVPTVLLIPLLAFDASGGRLGYGGGFYDRTLAQLPGRLRLGCAFSAQRVDVVPMGPYDIRLDAVATETGIIRIGG